MIIRKKIRIKLVFSFFVFSMLLMQESCLKSNAQNNQPKTSQKNKIIFIKDGAASKSLWIANYDGSAATEIPLRLPLNVMMDTNAETASVSISPDGKTIFFTATTFYNNSYILNVFSCDVDGDNLRLVIPGSRDGGSGHHPVAF